MAKPEIKDPGERGARMPLPPERRLQAAATGTNRLWPRERGVPLLPLAQLWGRCHDAPQASGAPTPRRGRSPEYLHCLPAALLAMTPSTTYGTHLHNPWRGWQ